MLQALIIYYTAAQFCDVLAICRLMNEMCLVLCSGHILACTNESTWRWLSVRGCSVFSYKSWGSDWSSPSHQCTAHCQGNAQAFTGLQRTVQGQTAGIYWLVKISTVSIRLLPNVIAWRRTNVFSSVCLFLCLCVCQHNNFSTSECTMMTLALYIVQMISGYLIGEG